ncbi:DnaD domain protein [Alicyclobacillus sendaiensis]|uniref:DnaD domain protein n=1 Tax=Alicyclobacillus sendaiensis TaxID=192387 RepID=UPI0026F4634B|nr:DnaD domain protein [Alicyclobacillus sendaiensis]
MNYMRELNAFRDWALLNRPSTGEVALWYSLMSINNATGWVDWFTVPNQTLQLLTGLSRQGLERARNRLIQRGLIEYQKGHSNHAGKYRLASISECQKVGTQVGTEVGTPIGTLVGTNRAQQWAQTGQNSSTLLDRDKDRDRSGVCVSRVCAREEAPIDDQSDDSVEFGNELGFFEDPFADDQPKDPILADPVVGPLLREIADTFGFMPNEAQKKLIKRCIDSGMSPELIRYDIEETKLHNGKAGYLMTMLKRQLMQGIKTLEQEQQQFKLVVSREAASKSRDRPNTSIAERQKRNLQAIQEFMAEEGST